VPPGRAGCPPWRAPWWSCSRAAGPRPPTHRSARSTPAQLDLRGSFTAKSLYCPLVKLNEFMKWPGFHLSMGAPAPGEGREQAPRSPGAGAAPLERPGSVSASLRGPRDREVAALVSAFLAFGSVKAFLPKLKLFSPRWAGLRGTSCLPSGLPPPRFSLDTFRCRVWTGDDLRLLFWNLRRILHDHGSLQDAFLSASKADGISRHRRRLERLAGLFYRVGPGGLGLRRSSREVIGTS